MDLTISHPDGAGPGRITELKSGQSQTWFLGTTSFSDHRTIHLTKLMASTMLYAAIKRQYSSVLPLLCRRLPVFDEICGTVMNYVFLIWVTLINIANTGTPLGSISFIRN